MVDAATIDPRAGRPDQSRRLQLVLGLGAAVVVLDQLSKAWALSALSDGPIHVVGTLRLALTHNSAGAFGLGGGFVPLLALAALGVVSTSSCRGRRPPACRWPWPWACSSEERWATSSTGSSATLASYGARSSISSICSSGRCSTWPTWASLSVA